MKINIYISTLNRDEKLKRCLKSIVDNDYKNWRLIVRNNIKRENLIKNFNKELLSMDGDWIVGLSDDMELHPDCLSNLISFANANFPDIDGAIGLNQANLIDCPDTAIMAIGRAFIDRFPQRKVMCEDYIYFAEPEQAIFVKSINKFKYCEAAKLNHFHPAFYPKLMDETHKELRKDDTWQKDRETLILRQRNGWLWGRDFNLLNQS